MIKTSRVAFRWQNNRLYADIESFSEAFRIEPHGRRVHQAEIFQTPPSPGPIYLALKPSCNAVDAGFAVPNLADDFHGAAPDLGAHESGRPLPQYGPRN